MILAGEVKQKKAIVHMKRTVPNEKNDSEGET
jgi:hypothetical protein